MKQLPINPVDVDVSESTSYLVIVGNDLLTKINEIIDFNYWIMELEYNNRKICCGISCWKKPEYNEYGTPVELEVTLVQ